MVKLFCIAKRFNSTIICDYSPLLDGAGIHLDKSDSCSWPLTNFAQAIALRRGTKKFHDAEFEILIGYTASGPGRKPMELLAK